MRRNLFSLSLIPFKLLYINFISVFPFQVLSQRLFFYISHGTRGGTQWSVRGRGMKHEFQRGEHHQ